jgi:hypothetical protein
MWVRDADGSETFHRLARMLSAGRTGIGPPPKPFPVLLVVKWMRALACCRTETLVDRPSDSRAEPMSHFGRPGIWMVTSLLPGCACLGLLLSRPHCPGVLSLGIRQNLVTSLTEGSRGRGPIAARHERRNNTNADSANYMCPKSNQQGSRSFYIPSLGFHCASAA